ncbi:uncharacterized protein LOC129958553 [Argiope bruennichi]|uniref:uncharacterized protein LOC129958553 n=1 Tax=Argiope bruennichi TaxID=94029 RepID=UPI0024942742|nr:uncharacterized protein LOC129958553 [Argiope bruennichi]XP_055927072.1 uncharacterized protein LOC129958553 [Argiope bruennichi]XP_055927073.1 uncharacterized protein LOC129958553 [Argiope bruennichi]
MPWYGPIEEYEYKHDFKRYEKEYEKCYEFILHSSEIVAEDITELLHPYFVNIYLYLLAGKELRLARKFSDMCPRKVFKYVTGYEDVMMELFSFATIREAWLHPYFRNFCVSRYQLEIPIDSFERLEKHLVDSRSMVLYFITYYKCVIKKTPVPPRDCIIVPRLYNNLLSPSMFSKDVFIPTMLRPEMTGAVEEFKQKIYYSLTTGEPVRRKSYKRFKCISKEETSQLREEPGTSTQGITYQMSAQPGTSSQGMTGHMNEQPGTSDMNEQPGTSDMNEQLGTSDMNEQPGTSSQGMTSDMNEQPGTSSQGMPSHMNERPGTSSEGIASQMAGRLETSSPEIEEIEHPKPCVKSSVNPGNFGIPEPVNEIDMYHCSIHYGPFQIQAAAMNEQNTHFACGYENDIEIFELDLEKQKSGKYTGCTARLRLEETNVPNLVQYITQTHLAPNRYNPVRTLTQHESPVTGLAYAPSGLLMSCSEDGTARVYNSSHKNIFGVPDYTNTATYNHSDSINDIAVSFCEFYFATAASDRTACLWNFNRPEPVETYVHPSEVTIAEFDPNPWPMFVVTYSDRQVFVWSVKHHELIWTIQCRRSTVNTIKVSPNEKHIACGDQRGQIKIYDIGARKLCNEIQAHRRPCHYLAFNDNGSLLASSGGDCRIKFWKVNTALCGTEKGCLKMKAEYRAAAFYPYYLKFHGKDFLLSINNAKY